MNGDFWGYVVWAIYACKAVVALFVFGVLYLAIDLPPWSKWALQMLGVRRLKKG